MTSERCPRNAFSGAHIPQAPGSARCRNCGGVIPAQVARLEGQAAAVDAAYASHGAWVEAFNGVLGLLAAQGEPFTSEDVTDRVGFYRSVGTNQNNAVGALMAAAAKRGDIHRVGFAPSRATRQHGATLAVWKGGRA